MDKLYVNLYKMYRQVNILQYSNIHTISKSSIIIRVFSPHYDNMTRPLKLEFFASFYAKFGKTPVADPEEVQGVPANPLPDPPVFKYPMKMK